MSYKGTVIETHGNKAFVMNDSCEYHEITIHGIVRPGDRIEYSQRDIHKKERRSPSSYRIPAAAAAVFLFFLLSFFVYRQMVIGNVYAYLTLDINPSIELKIDKDYNVVGARGLNGDGTAIIGGVPVNTALSSFLSEIVNLCHSNNYLKSLETNYIGICLYLPRPGDTQKLLEHIDLSMKNVMESNNLPAQVFYLVVDNKTWQEAESNNVSPTTYLLWQQARMKGHNFTLGKEISLQNQVLNALAVQMAARVSTNIPEENKEPAGNQPQVISPKQNQPDKTPVFPDKGQKGSPEEPVTSQNEPPKQEPPSDPGLDKGSDNDPAGNNDSGGSDNDPAGDNDSSGRADNSGKDSSGSGNSGKRK